MHEQPLQLLTAVFCALPIRRINHPDERIRLFEIILPVCAECLLAPNVPYVRTVVSSW